MYDIRRLERSGLALIPQEILTAGLQLEKQQSGLCTGADLLPNYSDWIHVTAGMHVLSVLSLAEQGSFDLSVCLIYQTCRCAQQI